MRNCIKSNIFLEVIKRLIKITSIYNKEILVVETKGTLDRSINTPITENTIKGPKDAFTENYQTNL